MVLSLVCALTLGAADAGLAPVAPPPLIPRAVLFSDAERSMPRLAPDGKRLAWLGPDAKGVSQVWVRSLDVPDSGAPTEPTAVTVEPGRGLTWFTWAEDSRTILYSQDNAGDEALHLFAVDLSTNNIRDLTPWAGVRATLLKTEARRPDDLLVTANVRDRKFFDVWRVNLKTGAAEVDTQNPGDVVEWKVDPNFQVRGAIAVLPDGSTEIRIRDSVKSPFKAWVTAGLEENLEFLDFTADGRSALLATSISSDMQRVVTKSLKTGTERILVQNTNSDPSAWFLNQNRHALSAVAFDVNGRQEWTTLEYSVKADFEALKAVNPGDVRIESSDRAETQWVVTFTQDIKSPQSYLWDRKFKQATPLFSQRPRLDAYALSEMKPIAFKARDGLKLNGYLSLPALSATQKPPLVVLVHAGPWSRDRWQLNPECNGSPIAALRCCRSTFVARPVLASS